MRLTLAALAATLALAAPTDAGPRSGGNAVASHLALALLHDVKAEKSMALDEATRRAVPSSARPAGPRNM